MHTFDIVTLLEELETAAPCGPDLEYDPDYMALEREVRGKPDVQYGGTVTAAVSPDWPVVRAQALALLARSRDLRLAMPLLRANLALHGVAGLADSIALLEGLLESRWDSVHPMLDPEDHMDPTPRINALAELTDHATVLRQVKEAALLALPMLGPLTLRMLDIASGERDPAPGQEKIAGATIEAALGDVEDASLEAATAALERAHAGARAIEAALLRRVGSAQALNLDELARMLKKGRDFLAPHASRRRFGLTPADADGAAPVPPSGSPDAPAASNASAPSNACAALGTSDVPGASAGGPISNRGEVLHALDRLLQYYLHHEPASPVPLFLGRAKWLVPKSFMEIMADLAPEGLTQIAVIRGRQAENQDE
ncbi:MAG: type VI secretion system protein TssA [Pseudomonadota bacterium]